MTGWGARRSLASACFAAASGRVRRNDPYASASLRELIGAARDENCLALIAAVPTREDDVSSSVEVTNASRAHFAAYQLTAATYGPILTRLHAEKIPVIAYKGAATSRRYYREPWRRPMNDVDLWVAHEHLSYVVRVFQDQGFDRIVLPGRSRSTELSHEVTCVPSRESGIRGVDIHSNPAPPTRHPFVFSEVLARSRPAELFGGTAYFLSPEDELVVAAVNQAYDHFRGHFLRAVDTALSIEAGPFDWGNVVAQSDRSGARAATWTYLGWVRSLLEAPIPAEVLNELAPGVLRRLALATVLQLDGGGDPRIRLPRRLEQAILTLPLMDSPTAFVRYLGTHGSRRVFDLWRQMKSGGDH